MAGTSEPYDEQQPLRRPSIGAILGVVLGMLALATQGGAQAFIISAQGSWYEPGVTFGDLIAAVQRFVDRFVAQVEVPPI